MGKGAPDYTRVTEIRGQDPTGELVTLAVDANGQLYAVVKGIDGTTLRTLAVDASGQLIMVPRGQSGNYMAVDASGNLTSVMKGVDGVTLRTVAVDSSGNIIGVLQGDYAGSPKTLSVDSQGRMLAVLTDPEDVFGNPNYMGAAELAVRLGSIHLFERRGQVLFQDDFRDGVSKWAFDSASGGGTVDITPILPLYGLFTARMVSSATSPYNVLIGRAEPYTALASYGIEVGVHTEAVEDYIRIGLYLRNLTEQWRFLLELDPVDLKLRYFNSAAGWTDIQAIGDVDIYGPIYHRLKLVVDLVNKKYVRGIFDHITFSLANVAPRYDTGAVPMDLWFGVFMAGLTATQCTIRISHVILTQNEP